MRSLSFLFILLFSHYTLALINSTKKFEDKMESFIDTMTKTNNIEVLLKTHKNKLSPDAYAQFVAVAKSAPSEKMFFFAKKHPKHHSHLNLKIRSGHSLKQIQKRVIYSLGIPGFDGAIKSALKKI